MKITIYYDYSCPFCYIAKCMVDKLEKELDLEVEWKGYDIHPVWTPDPDPAYLDMAWESVKLIAQKMGISIQRPPKHSRSGLALRATEYAKDRGKFKQYHNAVFRAYFLEGRDIERISVLQEIAKEVGLDAEEFKASMDDIALEERVWSSKELAKLKYKVRGVPTFIIDDNATFGVRPYEVLKKEIEASMDKTSSKIMKRSPNY